jgi:hypothetical protein
VVNLVNGDSMQATYDLHAVRREARMSLQTWQETLSNIVADGTALTAAARASLTQGQHRLARTSSRRTGSTSAAMIKITAQGRISCAVTTPGTARFDVSFGGTANCDSGAMNLNVVAKTNVPWWLEIVGTCRSVGNGTSATIFWFGHFQSEAVVGAPLPDGGRQRLAPLHARRRRRDGGRRGLRLHRIAGARPQLHADGRDRVDHPAALQAGGAELAGRGWPDDEKRAVGEPDDRPR